jgi:hypothetical protein
MNNQINKWDLLSIFYHRIKCGKFETHHIKKAESSWTSEFSSKKKTPGWFPFAAAPFSSVLRLIINIVNILQNSWMLKNFPPSFYNQIIPINILIALALALHLE